MIDLDTLHRWLLFAAAIVAILLLIAVNEVRRRLPPPSVTEASPYFVYGNQEENSTDCSGEEKPPEITYRAPTPAEAALGGLQELFEAAERELHEQGFTVLGDQAEEQAGGGTTGITRWFVDPSRTVIGFGVVRSRKTSATRPTGLLSLSQDSAYGR